MLVALFVGFLFGFLGSVPVAGPLAVVIVARAMEGRWRSAMAVAVGGASAELGYAFVAAFALASATADSDLLATYPLVQPVSQAVAAVIVSGLGLSFLLNPPALDGAPRPDKRGSAFVVGFSLVALNPTLLATWTGAAGILVGTFGVRLQPSHAAPFALAAGLGVVAWNAILIRTVNRYRDRFRPETLTKVLRGMGVFLLAVAAGFVIALLRWLLADA